MKQRLRSALVLMVCISVALLTPGIVTAATVTLQQGLSGYSGCIDSFIVTGGYSASQNQNFGQAEELRVACSHYASW